MKPVSRVGLASLLIFGITASGQTLYTVTPIGVGTTGSGINNSGQITGAANFSGVEHAIVYSNGVIKDIGTFPGGSSSVGNAINSAGQVTGWSYTAAGAVHAFLYTNGVMTDLGNLPGQQSSIGYDINNSGQITGLSGADANRGHAFLYSNGVMTDLGTLPGNPYSSGFGINDSGQITGASYDAFLWSNGRMADLGPLYGLGSSGQGINNSGQVVGHYGLPGFESYTPHAFLYSNGVMRDLGTLPRAPDSAAFRINNLGQVVGVSPFLYGPNRAFLYSNGVMTDLNTVVVNLPTGYTLTGVGGINDKGQILANGANPNATMQSEAFLLTPLSPLRFVPVSPCRIADTRNADGPFGGPELAAGSTRDFVIPNSACGISSTAAAYSLNVTVVPDAQLGYLTIWPSGQTQPLVSTLNSDGRIKANAVVVPAGDNGAVSVFATDSTQLVLDINGYFEQAGSSSADLQFYPLTPCRIADTRQASGPFGAPFLSGGAAGRSFPLLSSSCSIPATAKAYSLNFTAVPHASLGFLTVWPTGQTQPLVSTLNSSTGAVTANAALVPAGDSGAISVFAANDTDLVIDINGYFAPPATGGLSLYTVTPCRVRDTRTEGPPINSIVTNVAGNACMPQGVGAQAFVLNATVVPPQPLGYLSLWPDGQAQPLVSTLNALDGAITSNMAIVPTANGSIDAFAANPTQLVIDISAYFAP